MMSLSYILYFWTALVVILLIYLWAVYNSFIKLRNEVKTDFADVDVQLKRRASLIENLAEIVKGYAKHEKETFENVTKARSALNNPQGPQETAKAENMLTDALKTIFAVSENYPKLQASENFKKLQTDLKETEDKISEYRETYNQTVLNYNTSVQTFPNLLVANLFSFKEEEFFTAPVGDRESIKLKNT